MHTIEKPYVLHVAEIIYLKVCKIKKENPNFSNIKALEAFIESKEYHEISSGKFHDKWIEKLKKNNFVDQKTQKKIPTETIKLLQFQKEVTIKQLINFPQLYYAKNQVPLELSKRAFDHLWRMCESYELWCKETKQKDLLVLNIID
tara:strand:- start:684 stop:1121 length:438 start_codon:yes stop_codon:yes gene_type:complete